MVLATHITIAYARHTASNAENLLEYAQRRRESLAVDNVIEKGLTRYAPASHFVNHPALNYACRMLYADRLDAGGVDVEFA